MRYSATREVQGSRFDVYAAGACAYGAQGSKLLVRFANLEPCTRNGIGLRRYGLQQALLEYLGNGA